mmetsp:Transcript_8416/g.16756  ORF Transcript_8416/g.16756 Transcript_8416/m.16756 type:complete len:372 (+) Transcript_8416:183-1298(+)
MWRRDPASLTGNYTHDAKALRRAGDRVSWNAAYTEDAHEDNLEAALDILYQRSKSTTGSGSSGKNEGSPDPRVSLERVSQRLLLERQDLEEKIKDTRREFRKLARRKLVLEDEWKKLNVERSDLDEDKRRFASARRSSWFQSTMLPTSDLRRVRINVGGQLFETTERVLKRDPGSLLAALVGPDSPIKPDDRGCYIIDRDWVLFRHIIAFLRDGALPQSADPAADQLIMRLYKEAEFYRLETLRCAIREFLDPFQLVERAAAVPLSRMHKLERQMEISLRLDPKADYFVEGERVVYDEMPQARPEYKSSNSKSKPSSSEDWWTSTRYKGMDFRISPPQVDDDQPWRKHGPSTSAKPESSRHQPQTTWHRQY